MTGKTVNGPTIDGHILYSNYAPQGQTCGSRGGAPRRVWRPGIRTHVTVVGAIRLSEDARRRLSSVCKCIRPYTVRFAGVAKGTFFYECVFLLVEPTSEVGNDLS